jgi:hypothetical protein
MPLQCEAIANYVVTKRFTTRFGDEPKYIQDIEKLLAVRAGIL